MCLFLYQITVDFILQSAHCLLPMGKIFAERTTTTTNRSWRAMVSGCVERVRGEPEAADVSVHLMICALLNDNV